MRAACGPAGAVRSLVSQSLTGRRLRLQQNFIERSRRAAGSDAADEGGGGGGEHWKVAVVVDANHHASLLFCDLLTLVFKTGISLLLQSSAWHGTPVRYGGANF